jgi:hypothetical protein
VNDCGGETIGDRTLRKSDYFKLLPLENNCDEGSDIQSLLRRYPTAPYPDTQGIVRFIFIDELLYNPDFASSIYEYLSRY